MTYGGMSLFESSLDKGGYIMCRRVKMPPMNSNNPARGDKWCLRYPVAFAPPTNSMKNALAMVVVVSMVVMNKDVSQAWVNCLKLMWCLL